MPDKRNFENAPRKTFVGAIWAFAVVERDVVAELRELSQEGRNQRNDDRRIHVQETSSSEVR